MLTTPPAAIPAAPSEALMPSRMEVDSWRRSLLTWREASAAELIENTAGLKQCLSNAARLLLDHPALAQPAPTYRDSTPELHVGNSSFEDWFQAHPKACSGDKQLARDAYAAGMGDPLVCAKAAPVQQEVEWLRELLRRARGFVKEAATRYYDGTDGSATRASAASLFQKIEAALALTPPAVAAPAQAGETKGGA